MTIVMAGDKHAVMLKRSVRQWTDQHDGWQGARMEVDFRPRRRQPDHVDTTIVTLEPPTWEPEKEPLVFTFEVREGTSEGAEYRVQVERGSDRASVQTTGPDRFQQHDLNDLVKDAWRNLPQSKQAFRRCASCGRRWAGSIEVDRQEAEDLLEWLLQEAHRTATKPHSPHRGLESPGDTLDTLDHVNLAEISAHLEDVRGRTKPVTIRLEKREGLRRSKGEFLRKEDTIMLYVPSDWTLDMLQTGTPRLQKMLIHELTHAKDRIEGLTYEPGETRETDEERARYLNDPAEIQANISTIVHEIENRVESFYPSEGLPDAIRLAIKSSSTWRDIKDHLNEANRQKVLKEVYRQLERRFNA